MAGVTVKPRVVTVRVRPRKVVVTVRVGPRGLPGASGTGDLEFERVGNYLQITDGADVYHLRLLKGAAPT